MSYCNVLLQRPTYGTDALLAVGKTADAFYERLVDLEATHGSMREVLRNITSLRQLSDVTAGLCSLSFTEGECSRLRSLAAIFPSFDFLAWHPLLCRHVAASVSERLVSNLRAIPATGRSPASVVMAIRAATVALRMVARVTGAKAAEKLHPLPESMCSAGVLGAIASHYPLPGTDVSMLLLHLLPDHLRNRELDLLSGHQLIDLTLGGYVHLHAMGAIMFEEHSSLVQQLLCKSLSLVSEPSQTTATVLSAIKFAHKCRSDMGTRGTSVPDLIGVLTLTLPSSSTELERRAYLHAAAEISGWIVHANSRVMFTMETMAQVQGSMQALRMVLEREIEMGKWSFCCYIH